MQKCYAKKKSYKLIVFKNAVFNMKYLKKSNQIFIILNEEPIKV